MHCEDNGEVNKGALLGSTLPARHASTKGSVKGESFPLLWKGWKAWHEQVLKK